MSREELLKLLWETAALLDDKQLEKGTELLEALAFPERAMPPALPDNQLMSELSHVEFIAQLRDKLRTSEEAF